MIYDYNYCKTRYDFQVVSSSMGDQEHQFNWRFIRIGRRHDKLIDNIEILRIEWEMKRWKGRRSASEIIKRNKKLKDSIAFLSSSSFE